MLVSISFAAASKRSFGGVLPEMTSAPAWPSGPQTAFIAGMFGIGRAPWPASYQALTSGLVVATSA